MNLGLFEHQTIGARLFRRRWLAGAAVLLLSGVAVWGVWRLQSTPQRDAPVSASLATGMRTVTALGRLEPEGETVNLTAPTAVQESRVAQLLVQEGDRVKAGQVIAILDGRDRLRATLKRAEEQVRIAEVNLAQVKAGAKNSEFQAQRAEIARLQAERVGNLQAQRATAARLAAEVENARVEYERYASLYQQGAISASQRDTKRLTYTTAQRQLQEAEAQIARIETTSQQQIQQAQASLTQLSEVRPVDIEAATAQVQSAIAAVAEAKANLDQLYVQSPRSGQIIQLHTYPGEKIAEAGIATLGQTQQMMAIAEVYQDDIAQIQVGQQAQVTSPAIPETLRGQVVRIGLQVGQQQVVNEDPTANIDARVVEVHIRLDPASSQTVAGLTNLQVTTTIQADREE